MYEVEGISIVSATDAHSLYSHLLTRSFLEEITLVEVNFKMIIFFY